MPVADDVGIVMAGRPVMPITDHVGVVMTGRAVMPTRGRRSARAGPRARLVWLSRVAPEYPASAAPTHQLIAAEDREGWMAWWR